MQNKQTLAWNEFHAELEAMSVDELKALMDTGLSELLTLIQTKNDEITKLTNAIRTLKQELVRRGAYER